jgi:hypothetical protein
MLIGLPSKEYRVRRGKSSFTVEKTDKLYLSQVIEVNTKS